MEIKFDSPPIDKFTSKKKKALQSIRSQQEKKIKIEGKKPPKEVITGKASMPAPIVVPATRRTPPIKRI
jgi:hypothetical protein